MGKYPKELVDSIKENRMVIFVGAGLSRMVGLPGWNELVINMLRDLSDTFDKSEALINALENDIISPLDVLDKLVGNKKEIFGYFEDKLKESVPKSEVHSKLGELSKKVITTNFDKVIESNGGVDNVITQESEYNLSKLDKVDSFLLKIHGDISRVDKCLIFSSQYEELYGKDHLAEFQLQKIFSLNTVLFIGFSFADPYVKELFEFVSDVLDGYGPKHYILTKEEMNLSGLVPIKFDEYSEIPNIIDSLVAIKKEEEKSHVNIDSPSESEEEAIDGSSLPPDVDGWVGREQELNLLGGGGFKSYFITGMGGEGKSALASHYINDEGQSAKYEVIAWRDFKEEDHNFFFKVASLIKLLNRDFKIKEYSEYTEEEIIALFFKTLGDKSCLFVFDNVDSYVDLESFEPVGGIGQLFRESVRVDHKSRFIFTCRPFIRYASIGFYQFTLSGLTLDDTVKYFSLLNSTISNSKIDIYAERAFRVTKGHPLWLNLIIAHSNRGEVNLNSFLKEIEKSGEISDVESSIMSETLLKNTWKVLKDREKLLLRTLAESVRSETVEEYSEILSSELNFKNFRKALNSLKNLNLIVEKRGASFIELHPVVRAFVRKNYQDGDRNEFISILIKYYDKYVLVLKQNLTYKLSFDEFSNFTNKAELLINSGKFQEAISVLSEVYGAMSAAGYVEEFLRVSSLFFSKFVWSKKNLNKILGVEDFIQIVIHLAAEYGDGELTDNVLNNYENLIERKEDSYIRLCKIRSHVLWMAGQYEDAVNVTREALYLIRKAGLDDKYNIEHIKALASRDWGGESRINDAKKVFCSSHEEEDFLKGTNSNKFKEIDGAAYGNMGKCYQMKGEYLFAERLYCKSFKRILEGSSSDRLLNLGYAALWISEVLTELNKRDSACYFYKYAIEQWASCSPKLASRHKRELGSYFESSTHRSIISQELWIIEEYCEEWVKNKIEEENRMMQVVEEIEVS